MSLLDEESVKVIMAVAVFAGMVFLLFNLFSPVFNVADKTAESYFGSFEGVIDDIGSGNVNFYMMDNGKDKLNFYLVYFGGTNSFERGDVRFTRKPDNLNNVICVCSEDGKNVVCNYCKGMDLPVRFFYKDIGQYAVDSWSIGEGRRIELNKDKVNYAFSG